MLALFYDADSSDDLVDGRPVSSLVPGDRLPGGTRAWERLGVGQRCETWLAWSDVLCAPVVTKFPRPHQIGNPRAAAALAREVRVLDRNPHPALPQLYRADTTAAVPYLEVEYVDGPALDDEIDDHGSFAPADLALLTVQLLSGLRAVHAQGIVHVDIKPANIVLRGGRPVLLDFGSARPIGDPQPEGTLIGSPGYASPDLEAGDPLSTAMDVFGIGVTMHEALTGDVAFDPDLAAPDRPELVRTDDDAVSDVAMRMMAVDAAKRPTVVEAIDELVAVCRAAGVPPWPTWAHPRC